LSNNEEVGLYRQTLNNMRINRIEVVFKNNMRRILYIFLFFLQTLKLTANEPDINYQNLIFEQITVEDGLPSSTVNAIIQDEQGFMWFATKKGLCRFNAYEFKNYFYDPNNKHGLSNNDVICLLEAKNNKIWIGTGYGLNMFNKLTGEFKHYFHDSENDSSLWDNTIKGVSQDQKGIIWIETSKGINWYNPKKQTMNRLTISLAETEENTFFSPSGIRIDKRNNLWIGTWRYGLVKYNFKTKEIKKIFYKRNQKFNIAELLFVDKTGKYHLGTKDYHIVFDPENEVVIDTINNAFPRFGMVDNKGNIWAGTREELFIYSGETYEKISQYPQNKYEGIVFNSIFQDQANNIWISTLQGASVYYPYKIYFNEFLHRVHHPLYRDYAKKLFKDSHDNIWCGTFGSGLLLFDEELHLRKRFLKSQDVNHSIAGNYIWCIKEDHQGKLWIGTDNGISVFDPDQMKFVKTINKHHQQYSNLTHDLIYDILHDKRGNVWIATQEGLDVLKPNGQIVHITEQDGLCYYKPNKLIEDEEGNIWIGTYNGLSCFKYKKKMFKNYYYNPETKKGLSNKKVNALCQDEKGFIWIGTEYGLNKLNPYEDTIEYFYEKNGLINSRVERIYQDVESQLWFLTPEGISRMNPRTNKIVNFDKKHGLNINYSGMYLDDTILYIGEKTTGFYRFNINKVQINSVIPPIHITNVKVNGQHIFHGYPSLQLKQYEDNIIKLKHDQSSIEIFFAALNYVVPDKSLYKYRLDECDNGWITTSSQNRYAAYNNLSPGEYTFKVIASNSDGIWNDTGDSVKFKIFPPWWKTWWAMVLYFLMITGIFYLLYLLISSTAKIKIQQEKARIQEEKARIQHENDEFKLEFFTNISHEFRTPLTLIYGTLEQLFKKPDIPDSIRKQLNILYNHALRMKNLISQVLELRKMNVQKLKAEHDFTDVVSFLKRVYTSFIPLANQHEIQYEFVCPYDSFICPYDEQKVETILLNLLSNAFKFTPDKGKILYKVEIQDSETDKNINLSTKFIAIRISNTGTKISDNEIKKIFERFYQSYDTSVKNDGTGIGLALSKELVEVLKGTISVETTQEGVTSFIIHLPIPDKSSVLNSDSQKIQLKSPSEKKSQNKDKEDETLTKEKESLMLIAEDNEEMRSFIVSLFNDDFKIIEAENGKEGYNKTMKYMPDIIISDIMMPDYEGIGFCKDIKEEEKTNHIPFILLTAKTAEEYKIEGYKTGADDYVVKPFSSELLKARVNNLLSNRAVLNEIYRKRYVLNEKLSVAKENEIDPVDKFLYKVKNMVNQNMHKEDYSVGQLAKDLNISRIHLNRKFKNILGISSSEFIKTNRLNKAMDMLKTNPKLTISEIAYAVGFKEVSNFSRAFKAYHGKSPSNIDRDNYSLGEI